MSNGDWMRRLARHFEETRRRHPLDELLVMFDIDGTIVDLSHMIYDIMRWFDQHHGTAHFVGLGPADLDVHDEHLPHFLQELGLPRTELECVLDWYRERAWSERAILASHRPFKGVLEVIRWFQLQEHTSVALNTGRSESMRHATLASLNSLGAEFRVSFSDDMLFMSATGGQSGVARGKAAAVEHYRRMGFRVIAMVDNEPENLRAIASVDPAGEILLLHADTIFLSHRDRSPVGTVRGRDYDVGELMSSQRLRHTRLVWQGLTDESRLERFLSSNVGWGELSVRLDPVSHLPITRRESVWSLPLAPHEEFVPLETALYRMKAENKRVKLDLKEAGESMARALDLVATMGFSDQELWFKSTVDAIGHQGFAYLARCFPGSTRETPVDFLGPLIHGVEDLADEVMRRLRQWGLDGASLSWATPGKAKLLDRLETFGFEVDLCDVPDLEAYLRAALLAPRSITADLTPPMGAANLMGAAHKTSSARRGRTGRAA